MGVVRFCLPTEQNNGFSLNGGSPFLVKIAKIFKTVFLIKTIFKGSLGQFGYMVGKGGVHTSYPHMGGGGKWQVGRPN